MLAIPARVIATSFAIACFAGTLCYGIYNNNTWESILGSALLVMLSAWLVGQLLSAIALRSVDEHINQYREQNPIPNEDIEEPDEVLQEAAHPVNG